MVTIRDATPEDAMEVARVHVRSWQAAYRGLLPDEYLQSLRFEDRAARYTFDDTRPDRPQTILVVVDDAIQGFATTGPSRDDANTGLGELYAIYLAPEGFGTGLGRALMGEARRRLTERGFGEAVLWVLADNARARRFYQADGWEADGARQPLEMGGIVVDEVRYRRPLP